MSVTGVSIRVVLVSKLYLFYAMRNLAFVFCPRPYRRNLCCLKEKGKDNEKRSETGIKDIKIQKMERGEKKQKIGSGCVHEIGMSDQPVEFGIPKVGHAWPDQVTISTLSPLGMPASAPWLVQAACPPTYCRGKYRPKYITRGERRVTNLTSL